MGWLDTIAKIGLIGAAPFTGGATLAALPAVSAVSSVLGKQQEGKAQGAQAQAQAQQNQDRNALSLYQTQQGAENAAAQTDLQRKQYADAARSKAASQALMAALGGGGIPKTSIAVAGIQSDDRFTCAAIRRAQYQCVCSDRAICPMCDGGSGQQLERAVG